VPFNQSNNALRANQNTQYMQDNTNLLECTLRLPSPKVPFFGYLSWRTRLFSSFLTMVHHKKQKGRGAKKKRQTAFRIPDGSREDLHFAYSNFTVGRSNLCLPEQDKKQEG
jgi:hypothetical protein